MKKLHSLILVLALAITLVPFSPVKAATNYNHIIDDQIFDNANSMNAGQIDSFLNTFPNSCISTNNGFAAPDPTGYSPATSFTYGGDVSAGTVIYHAAQSYGINPQVLIATLEKEQGLVTGYGGNIVRNGSDCGALAISASMGYNCPDSLQLTSYSGFELYSHNGVPVTSVNSTCVEKSSYVGFSRQVINAAWLFAFERHRSEGFNNWYINKPGWDNSDDLNFCYSGFDVAGGPYYLCPDQDSHSSDPYVTHSGQYVIDGSVVTMTNGATAALYDYTPHFHGQDLFTSNFTNWFGSLYVPLPGTRPSNQSAYSNSPCNIPPYDTSQVGRLYNPDTQDYLYTTNSTEACYAVKAGYIWDGIVMQNVPSTDSNAIPVYRLANLSNHLFTTSSTVKSQYLTQYGYHDEGIGFYVYGSNVANSLPVSELTNGQSTFVFSDATSEVTYFQDVYGFSDFGTAFYTPNMSASSPGSTPVYRLSRDNQRLYTASNVEKNQAISNYGYTNEGTVSMGDITPNASNTPVYRLRSPYGQYFYTIDRKERDLAIINYNYFSEGIGFYELRYSNAPVYRLYSTQGLGRLFTSSGAEANQAINQYHYVSEGAGWYSY